MSHDLTLTFDFDLDLSKMIYDYTRSPIFSLFLSELCQIFTKFDNIWHTDSQNDKTARRTLIAHLF